MHVPCLAFPRDSPRLQMLKMDCITLGIGRTQVEVGRLDVPQTAQTPVGTTVGSRAGPSPSFCNHPSSTSNRLMSSFRRWHQIWRRSDAAEHRFQLKQPAVLFSSSAECGHTCYVFSIESVNHSVSLMKAIKPHLHDHHQPALSPQFSAHSIKCMSPGIIHSFHNLRPAGRLLTRRPHHTPGIRDCTWYTRIRCPPGIVIWLALALHRVRPCRVL
jgi:hypothetical protein